VTISPSPSSSAEPAPDFAIRLAGGTVLTLAAFVGEPLVVAFFESDRGIRRCLAT
jgi:peroxiredoxin